jgi:hypothetical protein
LVETKESHVVLRILLHIWKPSASGSTPTGFTPIDLSNGAEIALCSHFLLQSPQKNNFKRRDILAYFKLN